MKRFPLWVYEDIDYPEVAVPAIIRYAAKRYPDKLATIYSGSAVTYGEYEEASNRLAAALADMGIKKGERVGLMLPNCPQFIIGYFGIMKAGAVYLPISPMLAERELEHFLDYTEAETLITSEATAPLVAKVRGKTKLKRVIITGEADYSPPVLLALKGGERRAFPDTYDFLSLLREYPPHPPQVEIDPREDLAHLQSTGGTTGTPKAAMITHYNVMASVGQLVNIHSGCRLILENGELSIPTEGPKPKRLEKREYPAYVGTSGIMVTITPFFHSYGIFSLDYFITMGLTQVLLARFDPGLLLKELERWGASSITGAPLLFTAMMYHPYFKECDLSTVNVLTCGSAPITPEILDAWGKAIPDVIVSEAYGLTESSFGTHTNPRHRSGLRKIGSVGIPFNNMDCKIVDVETGDREMPIGEEGEVCIKGPTVMKGYWKKPEETRETIRDGWLYTGDIGKFDQDGYLYIVDRKKDMLIYKGYNVFPTELEDVLFTHPAVADCAVIGKPMPGVGEIPKAFIVLKPGEKATAEEITDFANERLAPYKKIREVEFREALPKSDVFKTLKRVLKDEERAKALESGGSS